jgi:hypothetical protein
MHIWFPDYDTYTIKNDDTSYVNVTIQRRTRLCYSLIVQSDLGIMKEIVANNIQPNSLDNFINL